MDILKYKYPPQIINYLLSGRGTSQDASYLVSIHFPWIKRSQYTDPIRTYQQAYLATLNMADQDIQEIYDQYVSSLLLSRIGDNFYFPDRNDYDRLISYIKTNPDVVQDIIRGNISADIATKAVQLLS